MQWPEFTLRYYQQNAVQQVFAHWERHRSVAVVLPTACGKTMVYLQVALEVVRRWQRRVLILAHRDYLLTEPMRRLDKIGFSDYGLEKAEYYADSAVRRPAVVFASVATLGTKRQKERLSQFAANDFGAVIVDEGHRAVAASYRNIFAHFDANPHCKRLLLTATPRRGDGVGLWNVAEVTAYSMSPQQAIQEGWIVTPRFVSREVLEVDFGDVRLRGSDFDAEQVSHKLLHNPVMTKICTSLAQDEGSTVVFCPRVDVARAYADFLNALKPGKAVAISEETPDSRREWARQAMQSGELQYLLNVDLVTEGYDLPCLERVVWTMPVASITKWTQGCGRVFRPHDTVAAELTRHPLPDQAAERRELIRQSVKPFGTVITYHPSNCRHQICTPADLLGGDVLPEAMQRQLAVVQQRTTRQEDKGGADLFEDLQTAQILLALRQALRQQEQLKLQARVQDQPFDGIGTSGLRLSNDATMSKQKQKQEPAVVAASWKAGEPASTAQQRWLLYHGLPADQLPFFSRWRAFVMRDLFERGIPLRKAVEFTQRQALTVRDRLQQQALRASSSGILTPGGKHE